MKNQNELDKLLDNLVIRAENEVDRIYARRLRNILDEISLMYEKYEVAGTLTLAEMTKFNRLQKSMDFIIGELVATYREVYRLTQTTMEEQYLEAYFRQAYLMEFEAQQKLGFGSISSEAVAAAVANPVKHLTLPAIMERNRAQVVYKIQQEISEGLIAGESYAKMAKRLRERLDIDKRKSQLIARTEAGRAQTIAKEASYQQAKKYVDVEKVWDASLDGRTRKTHSRLDGKKADEEGYFHLGRAKAKGPRLFGIAKEDINCRCAIRMQIRGKEPEVRRARLEDGSTKVIPYTTYDEWKDSRIGEYVKKKVK
jgi:SPP1 gp7 family putative phage head morphogenesis protein